MEYLPLGKTEAMVPEFALKYGDLLSRLERHQPLVYAVTQVPLLSLQRCRDFQTRKLACTTI